MSMQIAQRIPFRPKLCPECINYVAETRRCRAYAVESWPSPLLAEFSSETVENCTRFLPSKKIVQAASLELEPLENEAALEIEKLMEPEPAANPAVENLAAATAVVENPLEVEPVRVETAAPAEMPAPPPERGTPRIHCHKCSTENPTGADRCQRCNANLLPGEDAGSRLGTFITMLIIAAGLGYLVYRWYIQDPGSAPDIPFLDAFLNPIVLGIAAFLALITALVVPFRRTPEYAKYQIRATRHEKLNPWQALTDLERAMDAAPDKELGKIVKQRAGLFEKLGFTEDAARDYLLLLTSPDRFKGEADVMSMFTGADKDVYQNSRRSSEISTILASGKAKAVGYCPQCDLVVELNKDERCILHPKVKGREVNYVIPADVLAGKLAVMQKMEVSKPKVSQQISKLLVEGKATAIGYCPKCTGVVELTPERRCQMHPKARVANIQYAVPRDLPAARKRIFTARQGNRLNSRRVVLYVIGLLLLAYAAVILLDIDLGSIFQR